MRPTNTCTWPLFILESFLNNFKQVSRLYFAILCEDRAFGTRSRIRISSFSSRKKSRRSLRKSRSRQAISAQSQKALRYSKRVDGAYDPPRHLILEPLDQKKKKITSEILTKEQLQQIHLFIFPFSPYREIPFLNFNIYGRSVPFLLGLKRNY